jgi:hypothetical protein
MAITFAVFAAVRSSCPCRSGRTWSRPPTQACLDPRASEQACVASIAKLQLWQRVTYQPAGRYWAFQWYETGIFLALALVLTALCAWRIRCLSLF